jgi:hypothetical protein
LNGFIGRFVDRSIGTGQQTLRATLPPINRSTVLPFNPSAATLPNLYITFIPPFAKVVMLFSTPKGPVQKGSGNSDGESRHGVPYPDLLKPANEKGDTR